MTSNTPKAALNKPFLDVAPTGANTIVLQTEDGGEFEVPMVGDMRAMQLIWTIKLLIVNLLSDPKLPRRSSLNWLPPSSKTCPRSHHKRQCRLSFLRAGLDLEHTINCQRNVKKRGGNA
jgi:hypothetical protein